MKNFKTINIIAGWVIFTIAAFVYLSTIEPTASFWDCGEFISSAFKLEVGHPPGAPFFMIIGRFFTLLAGNDVTAVRKNGECYVGTVQCPYHSVSFLDHYPPG